MRDAMRNLWQGSANRRFANRTDAGARLGVGLSRYRGTHPMVLGIPRGGVPVAAEVARALDGDLDVIVARKLGAPRAPELAIGAVTSDGVRYLNDDVIASLDVTPEYLDQVTTQKAREAQDREQRFRAGQPPLPVEGRIVILVDDGLATGATMVAAARSIRRRRPKTLVIAVPVGPKETCQAMHAEADDVICLHTPPFFMAVGAHYRDFSQTEDADVERILREWRMPASTSSA